VYRERIETETTFFQSGDVAVTNARFVVGAQTFAMQGITSVQDVRIPAHYGGPVALILLGAVVALISFGTAQFVLGGLGVLLIGLGIWFAVRKKPMFAVVLRTAGGEVTAYQSYDSSYISQIIEAMNQSIISRG